jgi:hypothetical protein
VGEDKQDAGLQRKPGDADRIKFDPAKHW